jgi:hypothetical protein
MADNVYLVGTWTASNTVESIQENELNAGSQGNFNCLVLRAVGFNPPPYFASEPLNGGGYVGDSALLSAVAAGDSTIPSPAITYQWKSGPTGGPYTNLVEGAKWSGTTTATLTINNLTAGDATPVYVLIASNGGGSTTSREVTLAVQPAFTTYLLGHWLSGAANFADTAGYQPPGIHDGLIINGTSYFTNDVPPNATGQALFLNNAALVITNSSLAWDFNYTNTFDDTISNHFTVVFWAKGFPGGANPWISKFGENGLGWQVRRFFGSQRLFTMRGTGSPGGDDQSSSISSNDGQWHHYAATFDTASGLRQLYTDGQLGLQTFGNGPYAQATAQHLVLGGRDNAGGNNFGQYFTGLLYDVRVYNYALSQTQVRNVARLTPPSPTRQVVNGNQLELTWPWGTLLGATNILGPWNTNAVTSPYTNNMTDPQHFFRVSNP